MATSTSKQNPQDLPAKAVDSDVLQQDSKPAALEAILNSVADGILVVSLKGEIVFMNPQFIKMWSIPEHITDAMESLKIAYPQTKSEEGFLELVQSIYTHPKKHSYDLVELKDGRIFELISIPQHVDGQIIGRVWTYRDVTEQKQTEHALRESETRYRELLAAERRHIQELKLLDKVRLVLSQELELPVMFRRVVEAISETFGYNLVSIYLLEGGILKLQHQVGYNNVIERIDISSGVSGQVARTGQPILIKDVSEHPNFLGAIDGIVSEVCVPLLDADHVMGFINVESTDNIELTEADLNLIIALSEHISVAISRAKLYTKLWQQEAQYRKLFELAPIGMGITKHDGNLIYVNQAFANTLGYEPHELEKKNLRDITHPDDLEKNLQLIEQLFNFEISNYTIEKRYIRKDGSHAPVSLQVSMLPNMVEEDEPSMIAQIVDMSELKQAEEVLRQAQKMESLGIMAGGIAHDFNNLLVAMIGQTSLAINNLGHDKAEKAAKHMEKALTAAERAAALTRQLLAYSGKGKFEISPVNLNEIVLENYHLFEVALPKNVKIETHLDQNLPFIEADSSQIQQIIMNLILNGAEAIHGRAGQVTLTTRTHLITEERPLTVPHNREPLEAGDYVVLEVKDNGTGMNKETLERIFDPFFTTKFTGRGLGLAAVLGIVSSHGGGLQVKSKAGKGTTFTLYFPAASTKSAENNNDKPPAEPPLPESQKQMTILIIDDEIPVLEAITDILETDSQLNIITTKTGQKGLEKLRQQQETIDLIILDLAMPDLSGEDTYYKIREQAAELPIIISSGYSETEVSHLLANDSKTAFLSKPYSAPQLLEMVHKQLT